MSGLLPRLFQHAPAWLLMAPFWLAACAPLPTRVTSSPNDAGPWEGRLALTAAADGLQAPQAFFAGFEWRGDPTQGQMRLFTPLGTTLATLTWSAQEAQLVQGSEVQRYNSVAEMTQALMGQALPLATLWDWLQGRPTPVEGWEVDLSEHAAGKITAMRHAPPAQLKLILNP